MDDAILPIPASPDVHPAVRPLGLTEPCCGNTAPSLKILFLTGYGSRPGGPASAALRAEGHSIVEPDLPDGSFARSVTLAQRIFHRHQPDLVVGWSRGGAVAMSLDSHGTPLILIAPAWKNWGTRSSVHDEVTILHSPHDDLVPIEDSQELLQNSGLSPQQLLAVGDDHHMIDDEAVLTLLEAVEILGKRCEKKRAA